MLTICAFHFSQSFELLFFPKAPFFRIVRLQVIYNTHVSFPSLHTYTLYFSNITYTPFKFRYRGNHSIPRSLAPFPILAFFTDTFGFYFYFIYLYGDFSPSRYIRALGVFLSIEFPSSLYSAQFFTVRVPVRVPVRVLSWINLNIR